MKNLFFLIGSLWLAVSWLPAAAQSQPESEALRAEQRLAETVGAERLPNAPSQADARNVASLLQLGAGNRGVLTQNNTGLLANAAFIEQVGLNNVVNFTQTGEGNKANVEQRGSRNQLNVQLTGDNNELNMEQNGRDNRINSIVSNDNRKYEILQQGNMNVLNQLETSPASPRGYSVEMRGNGIQLTIEQGRARP